MKDGGVHCQQVLSLSPECWAKMIMQEIAVVGSVAIGNGRYWNIRHTQLI
jgi:hypothetical protein